MALQPDEPKSTATTLIVLGIPLFLLAVIISIITHQYAHIVIDKFVVSDFTMASTNGASIMDHHDTSTSNVFAAVAGPVWTLVLALASFALFVRYPRNLFFSSMAFVNASMRLPETLKSFLQILFNSSSASATDESISLALLPMKDPSGYAAAIFIYFLLTFFLTLTIVHDVKNIPWKWFVAAVLFSVTTYFSETVWQLAAPIIS